MRAPVGEKSGGVSLEIGSAENQNLVEKSVFINAAAELWRVGEIKRNIKGKDPAGPCG